ncbi:MAG: hypothetical protein IJB40_00470 [Alistipes sp.]|nr:hypothetical protein [Alistipes sp.]
MASGLPSKCSFTDSKLRILGLRPASTDDAEREQRVLARFAELRGGKATLVVG